MFCPGRFVLPFIDYFCGLSLILQRDSISINRLSLIWYWKLLGLCYQYSVFILFEWTEISSLCHHHLIIADLKEKIFLKYSRTSISRSWRDCQKLFELSELRVIRGRVWRHDINFCNTLFDRTVVCFVYACDLWYFLDKDVTVDSWWTK